ncbi:hypothetical protein GCM10028781_11820 [Nostocoides australiense]
MKVDDVTGTRSLVQPVDVLADDRADATGLLKRRDRPVPVVGAGGGEPLPPGIRPGPIALPPSGGGDELAMRHRRHPPSAVRPAIVGDPRIGAQPRPGQHERRAILQEVGQFGGGVGPVVHDKQYAVCPRRRVSLRTTRILRFTDTKCLDA